MHNAISRFYCCLCNARYFITRSLILRKLDTYNQVLDNAISQVYFVLYIVQCFITNSFNPMKLDYLKSGSGQLHFSVLLCFVQCSISYYKFPQSEKSKYTTHALSNMFVSSGLNLLTIGHKKSHEFTHGVTRLQKCQASSMKGVLYHRSFGLGGQVNAAEDAVCMWLHASASLFSFPLVSVSVQGLLDNSF